MLFLWLVLSILCEGSALRGDHEKERHWRFKSGELTDLEFRVGGSYDYLHRSPTPSKHPRVSDDAEFAHYKPPTPGNVYKNTGFVKTNGTRLMLHGKKWEFAGTNAFYGALEYIMSDEELRYVADSVHALVCTHTPGRPLAHSHSLCARSADTCSGSRRERGLLS